MTESTAQTNLPELALGAAKTGGTDVADLRELILEHLISTTGKDRSSASQRDWFIATALVVRDQIIKAWIPSKVAKQNRRRVYYMSLEFLIGRLLMDALNNLGLTAKMREALAGLDVDLDKLQDMEPDAALGNGGLGRLAACFMESMATLSIAAYGYGIRYDHGLFRQAIKDGWQHEYPEDWLAFGTPWEFPRPEIAYAVGFGGSVESLHHSSVAQIWRPSEVIEAVAYDVPLVGWRGAFVNSLRLWSSRAPDPLRLDVFNAGDYVAAQTEQVRAEFDLESALSEQLDARRPGMCCCVEEYFFASASLQDRLHPLHLKQHGDITKLAEHVAIQLNENAPRHRGAQADAASWSMSTA